MLFDESIPPTDYRQDYLTKYALAIKQLRRDSVMEAMKNIAKTLLGR
jgi:hypothetical protein